MIPVLYEKEELTFTSNGIGALTEAVSCVAEQERNGYFEVEMQYPMTGKWFSELKKGRYIYCAHDEGGKCQPFEIYKIAKPINGVCTYYGRHIRYKLSKVVVKPFVATSIADAMTKLRTNSLVYHDFYFYTTKQTEGNFNVSKPSTISSLLAGEEGSLLDVYGGGEYEFDMFNVTLKDRIGTDTHKTVRYGKNMTDFDYEEDYADVYTAIAPYWEDSAGEEEAVYLPEGYLVMPNVPTLASNLITDNLQDITTDGNDEIDLDYYDVEVVPMDLSDQFETKPTTAELREKAMAKLGSMSNWKPAESITVEMPPVGDGLKLCDTVDVYFTQAGVTATNMKIIKTRYDVLNDRYLALELGQPKKTLSDTITETVDSKIESNQKVEFLNTYVASMAEIITNGLGLFFSKELKPGGGYVYYLHNKPKRENSQYQWTINAQGFAISQDYGQTWTAGIDANGNAVFNVLSANVVEAMEIYGAYIEGAKIVFAPDSKAPITAAEVTYSDGWGGVLFKGEGDFTVQAGTIGLTAKGKVDSDHEFQIVGRDPGGAMRNLITMKDNRIDIAHYNETGTCVGMIRLYDSVGSVTMYDDDGDKKNEITLSRTNGITLLQNKDDGTSAVSLTMHPTNGLGIWINGVGYNNLGFVNDGQGHAVLGK